VNYLSRLTFCFDLDGTLVDTAPDLVRVLNLVIAEEGLAETNFKEARKAVGYGSRMLITEACARAEHNISDSRVDELQQLFLKLYADNIAEKSAAYPGVIQVLEELLRSGARLSVCTNKPGYLARPLLNELSMTYLFENIVGGDDVGQKKPSPEHIWASAGHNDAKNIVMVGDSYPDMRAAHNAKVAAMLVTYGYSQISPLKLKADARLRDFRELPSAVHRLYGAG